MATIEKSIDVDVPLRTVYNQWTQFEDFPYFMEGVRDVRQLDDTHLRWCVTVGGKDVEWDAEITEQMPDERISWRSTMGKPNAGTIRFEPVDPDRTRITVSMDYEPEGLVENVGDLIGVTSRRVGKDLERFKTFIEERRMETGEWRGEVHGGRKMPGGDSQRMPR
jgi:uncharacterized membrane protein